MSPLLLPCVTACLLAVPPPAPAPREVLNGQGIREPEKDYSRLAAIPDELKPEQAAPILKQMAESGPKNLDKVAGLILRMDDKSVMKIFETINDPDLEAEIASRMQVLKARQVSLPVAPAPRPVRDNGAK